MDLQPGEDVPNRSIMRAIVENAPEPAVSCVLCGACTCILVYGSNLCINV